MRELRTLGLLFLSLLVVACASRRIEPYQEPRPDSFAEDSVEVIEPVSPEEQLEQLRILTSENPPRPALGRGDILNISVYGENDLTIDAIPIRPDGMISFPLVGDVRADGLSVDELNQSLSDRLSEFIISPKVSVIVQAFNSQRYTIFGEVVEPGVYPLTTRVSITEAVADAGGLQKGQFRGTSVELADLSRAFLARGQQVLPVDFVRLIRDGDLRYDIELQAGDYIYIPSGLAQEVYVLGEVEETGLFAFRESMPMSRTLAQARGFTADADISRIHVVRGGLQNPTIFIVNFREVLNGNAREIPLQPGDVVYVPPTGLTRFARVIDKIFPAVQALQVGILLNDAVQD